MRARPAPALRRCSVYERTDSSRGPTAALSRIFETRVQLSTKPAICSKSEDEAIGAGGCAPACNRPWRHRMRAGTASSRTARFDREIVARTDIVQHAVYDQLDIYCTEVGRNLSEDPVHVTAGPAQQVVGRRGGKIFVGVVVLLQQRLIGLIGRSADDEAHVAHRRGRDRG